MPFEPCFCRSDQQIRQRKNNIRPALAQFSYPSELNPIRNLPQIRSQWFHELHDYEFVEVCCLDCRFYWHTPFTAEF